MPVFWACGVTPQSVLENSKPDFCITHSPGKMLITDKLNNDLASFPLYRTILRIIKGTIETLI